MARDGTRWHANGTRFYRDGTLARMARLARDLANSCIQVRCNVLFMLCLQITYILVHS